MIEIFRRIGAELATTVHSDHRFQLADRVVIFPEMRCPYCSEILRCKRVWWIKAGRVPCWWDVVRAPSRGRGRRRPWLLKRVSSSETDGHRFEGHPHLGLVGDVCMGGCETEEQALFTGVHIPDSYWGNSQVFPWLETVWDHECPEKSEYLDEEF